MASSPLLGTVVVAFLSVIVHIIVKGYRQRLKIAKLRQQGIAMPEWNWLTGHLLVLKDKLDRLPADASPFYAFQDLVHKEFADTEIFVMDYWPMYEPSLMITSPEISAQVSNELNLQRDERELPYFAPVVGGPSLITMTGEEWKYWKTLFNPAFSSAHLLNLVPSIVDSVEVFCELLRESVGNGIVTLDDMTGRLTMEIITKTTLDTSLHNQRSEHVLSHALNTILAWHSFWDPRTLLNPLRPIIQWYYGNVAYSFIRTELQNRFEEIKAEKASSARGTRRAKSVATLAIEDYLSQNKANTAHLDEKFIRITSNQIRLFLFAGNDTTSSTMVYMFHFLSQNPSALTKLREEHDLIFGSEIDTATQQLRETPILLNQCKYTLAVIKETLRLCPPSGSLRYGHKNATLTDKHGNVYPTDGLKVTVMHRFVHRHARFWPRPDEFLPERWLPTVQPGDELYVAPNTGAYRPFEQGPRNCIGQTLVLNELRVVLIMTARRFVVTPAYEEWDAAKLSNRGAVQRFMQRLSGEGKRSKTALGERAYQTFRAGGHPADGYPCRVELVER